MLCANTLGYFYSSCFLAKHAPCSIKYISISCSVFLFIIANNLVITMKSQKQAYIFILGTVERCIIYYIYIKCRSIPIVYYNHLFCLSPVNMQIGHKCLVWCTTGLLSYHTLSAVAFLNYTKNDVYSIQYRNILEGYSLVFLLERMLIQYYN